MAQTVQAESMFERLVTAYKRGGLREFSKRVQAMDEREWIGALAYAVTREAKTRAPGAPTTEEWAPGAVGALGG